MEYTAKEIAEDIILTVNTESSIDLDEAVYVEVSGIETNGDKKEICFYILNEDFENLGVQELELETELEDEELLDLFYDACVEADLEPAA